MPEDLKSVEWSSEDSSSDDEDEDDDLNSGTNDEDEASFSTSAHSRDEINEINGLLRKESKAVHMWREIVTGMLVITAVLVTVTTYLILTRAEVENFSNGVST